MSDDPRLHYQRFQQNASFDERLEATLPQDRHWCRVVWFYSAALDLVDAYLTIKLLPVKAFTHVDRQRALQRYPECRRFAEAYRRLQGLSEQVRYDEILAYNDYDHTDARRYYARVVAVVEPWVKNLLGPTDPDKEQS
jgi:hypothetical protein